MKVNFLRILLFLCPLFISAQRQRFNIDSLEREFKNHETIDSVRVNLMINIALSLNESRSDIKRALDLVDNAVKISDNLGLPNQKVTALMFIAQNHIENSEYTKAIDYILQALKISEETKNIPQKVRALRNLGVIYHAIKDYQKSLKYYFDALKEAKKYTLKREIPGIESNIGILYQNIHENEKALSFYELALRSAEEIDNKTTKSFVLNSIGMLHQDKGLEEKDRQELDLSIKYFKLSLALKKELNHEKGIANALGNIGKSYAGLKFYGEALKFLKEGEQIALKLNYKEWLREGYQSISECYENTNDLKNALSYFKKYTQIKDSLASVASLEKIEELQGLYDTEKKDKEILLLQKDNDLQTEKLRRQSIMITSIVITLAVLLGFLFFISKSNRQKKLSNITLSRQNQLIQTQKTELEIQKKNIIDSINYARKIQYSILPPITEIQKHFPESFVCYRPKDIVSGDFYWFVQKNNCSFYAVADCTGHGVPGAFMSLVASSLLNEIINKQFTTKPSVILEKLHRLVYETFKQEKGDEYAQDGLDISIIIHKQDTNEVFFAGARSSVIIVKNGIAELITATPKPIGGLSIINTPEPDRKFDEKEIKIENGDLLFMFTDGVLDMFNHLNQKYGIERLKGLSQLLWKKRTKEEMHETVEKELNYWLHNESQIDDILITAIRFSRSNLD